MSSSSGPSLFNIVLLYFSLMGIGAIAGYGGFYWLFFERCSQLMTETQTRHAISRQEIQKKYEDAIEGQRQCMSDATKRKLELSDIRGRFEAQATLAERHQALLLKQEETLLRLGEAQTTQETASQIIASLRDELRDTRTDLAEASRKLEDALLTSHTTEMELRQSLQAIEDILDKRNHDVEDMSRHLDECDKLLPVYRDEISLAQNYLRTRHHQQCKMEYGKGPFVVTFTLRFPKTMGPNEEPNVFEVELAPLSEMPHTVFTFLDLVHLQLYDGTSFIAADNSRIEGGSPNHAPTPHAVKLHERYAKFGYNRSPLGINEYSPTYPHEAFTLGFAGSPIPGPTLVINLMDNSASRGPNDELGKRGDPCFGKIISGFDTLQRIQNAPRAADGYRLAMNIEITSVRLKRANKNAQTQSTQEL